MADKAGVFSSRLVRSIILGRSSVVAAVVNVDRVNSVGLCFVPKIYSYFHEKDVSTRKVCVILSLNGQIVPVCLTIAITTGMTYICCFVALQKR